MINQGEEKMINREDMMELTRRMNLSRTSMTRIAGSYMDEDGFIDGTFNVNFLNLKASDREKNLAIAKAIPFSKTNVNLKRYRIPKESMGKDSVWRLLMAVKSCGLKNDALMDIFYDMIAEHYDTGHAYGVFMFHDRYDVPVKAADHERLWESEEIFEYLICAICPITGDYEPGKPEWGFIFPAFSDRSEDWNYIDIFQADENKRYPEMLKLLGVGK